jgi:hypothetical protein
LPPLFLPFSAKLSADTKQKRTSAAEPRYARNSMFEMPNPREHHRQIMFVRRGDDLLVAY